MELLIDDHLKFSDEHKRLLTAQVLQDNRIDKLVESLKELAEAQADTRERLDTLLLTVDDLIRRPPA
jgi:ABC-type transporter Mla subunit MlaD